LKSYKTHSEVFAFLFGAAVIIFAWTLVWASLIDEDDFFGGAVVIIASTLVWASLTDEDDSILVE
jgi:hypothetical protein